MHFASFLRFLSTPEHVFWSHLVIIGCPFALISRIIGLYLVQIVPSQVKLKVIRFTHWVASHSRQISNDTHPVSPQEIARLLQEFLFLLTARSTVWSVLIVSALLGRHPKSRSNEFVSCSNVAHTKTLFCVLNLHYFPSKHSASGRNFGDKTTPELHRNTVELKVRDNHPTLR